MIIGTYMTAKLLMKKNGNEIEICSRWVISSLILSNARTAKKVNLLRRLVLTLSCFCFCFTLHDTMQYEILTRSNLCTISISLRGTNKYQIA